MFAPGDIVEFYCSTSGYPKYHVCIVDCDGDTSAKFLFINSDTGFASDLVLKNGDFPCIPPCKSGISVVSCSQLVLKNAKQLVLFKAKKIGELSPAVARKLEAFVPTALALTKAERTLILGVLAKIK
jgi:hypothetical protein